MPWPIPEPVAIADRYSASLEAAFATDASGQPQTIDARSANSVMGNFARVHGETQFEAYLYQLYISRELMVDTAIDWLGRHADIWGVPRLPPTQAIGNVVFTGAPTTAIPIGTLLSSTASARFVTTAAATVASGGTISAPIQAQVAGAAGNVPPAATLTLVSPIAGLTAQTAVVDSQGIAGGADIEAVDAWRARILARIRQPPAGGDASDYTEWALEAGAAYVGVVPAWVGLGSVGVIIAMAGPAGATTGEVAAVQAFIDGVRPVTALVVVVAATLVPINITLSINPDTPALRTQVAAALALFFETEATVGGTIYLSRAYAAIGSVTGEYSSRITVPGGDTTVTNAQLPVLGTITWT